MIRNDILCFVFCLYDPLLSIIQEAKSDMISPALIFLTFPKLDIWTRLFIYIQLFNISQIGHLDKAIHIIGPVAPDAFTDNFF